jgi:hypothetical protein
MENILLKSKKTDYENILNSFEIKENPLFKR